MENVEGNTDNLGDFKNSEAHVEEIVIARTTDEELFELSQESLQFKSWTSFHLFLMMFVQGCGMAGYGIDWTVISGINTLMYLPSWHNYFTFPDDGPTLATLNALMNIGSIAGAPFLSLADVMGRGGIQFVGNFIVIIAALIQGFAINKPMLMAGRFFLGFGSSLMAQPQYIGEVAPTHLRGRLTGFYGACFQVGSVGMSAGMIGFGTMSSNWSWRIPLMLEGLFPAIVCATIYFISPESPRYLILSGQKEKAAKVIARYHITEGNNVEHPLVKIVVQQMEESIANRTDKQFWNWAGFFRKGARSRVGDLIVYSIFQSWNGGGITGQYLGPALETVGITKTTPKNAFQFGSVLVYLVFTVVGSFIIDKLWRRTLIFTGLGGLIFTQTIITILSWQYNKIPTTAIGFLTIFFYMFFQAWSATFLATMHNIYPVEVLSLSLRAKGMGLYSLVQSAASAVQQYGISIGFQRIGYKLWAAYVIYNCIQVVLTFFVFPETSQLSLEEIDAVFETPGVKPVKMSIDIKKAQKEHLRLEAEQAAVVQSEL